MLLFAASCVPPPAERAAPILIAAAAAEPSPVLPGFASLDLPVAREATPPPAVLAAAIAPGRAAAPFDLSQATGNDEARALECLTAAVYHEARSETEDGQRAVAQVVLNRVRHRAFPKSVCGVVYQGSQRTTGCQFSFTCDGSLGRRREPAAWEQARRIAQEALGGAVYAPVGVATHYHTTAIRPWWAASLTRAVTVGSHIFYRWRGEWGNPTSLRRPYVGGEGGAASVRTASTAAAVPAERETVLGVRIHHGVAPPAVLGGEPEVLAVRVHRSGGRGQTVPIPAAFQAAPAPEPAAAAPAPEVATPVR